MRIVSGRFKGIEIISPPKSLSLRPTSDKVREAIFDVIRFEISGATFLDLFAGSGAMGIEAISEGAKFSVFVEKDVKAIKTIQTNIKRFGIKKQSLIVKQDVISFIRNPLALQDFNQKFDIAFLDPPYASQLAAQTMKEIVNFPHLANESLIIAEHKGAETLSEEYQGKNILKKFRDKKYGKIAVSYYILQDKF